jgi:hypothetical protein
MAPTGYLESASDTNDEPDEDTMDARFDISEPTKCEVLGGRSPSFSFPSSARRYNTIEPRPAGEREARVVHAKAECGHDIVVRCSVGSTESRVPIGEKHGCRVAGAPRRGSGRGDGGVGEGGRSVRPWKGIVGRAGRRAPVGLSGGDADETLLLLGLGQ